MRGATGMAEKQSKRSVISIHTPHAGSDVNDFASRIDSLKFQSTLPMRGATLYDTMYLSDADDFNPHSPCGERPLSPKYRDEAIRHFNPHSPCGERHGMAETAPIQADFNPHSPCGERRLPRLICHITAQNFNPHSPCGERLYNQIVIL